MLVGLVLLLVAILAASFATSRQGASVAVLSLWLICGSLAILVIAPFGYTPVGAYAGLIVAVGIASLAIPIILARRVAHPSVRVGQGEKAVAFARLTILSAAMLAMVIIGYQAFVTDISTAAGYDFSQLSLTQIRAAQTGTARGGGILSLMGAAGPILACFGVYGALRYSRWWLVLSAIAAWVALQSPSRLNSISLIIVILVFYLYARRGLGSITGERITERGFQGHPSRNAARGVVEIGVPSPLKWGWRRRLSILAIALISAIAVFTYVGSQLGKSQSAAEAFPAYNWPQWTLSPFLYFSGGFPALSQALQLHANPFDAGGSYYSLVKLANVFAPQIKVPETIAGYVNIPSPFNLYTGFGEVYFDSGIVGVIFTLGFLGWLATIAHRKAMEGRIEWAWASAVIATVLFSLPQSFILFHLDLDLQLLVGFGSFWFIRTSRRRATFRTRASIRNAYAPLPTRTAAQRDKGYG